MSQQHVQGQGKINYLRISVTDRCNLRCRYCMPAEGFPLLRHEDILSYEEILQVVRSFVAEGISKVRVTGGEPLVRRNLSTLITAFYRIPGIEDISVTTNGVLLREYAKDLRRAGLRRINISLDSLRRDRFLRITKRDALGDVLEGITEAREAGFNPIKINVVIMKGINDDEILDFISFAKTEEATVRFIEYMPWGTEVKAHQGEEMFREKEIREVIESRYHLIPHNNQVGNGPARTYKIEGASGKIGFISPMSRHICGECNRLRLTAEGKLRLCLFSDREIDLKPLLRNGRGDEELRRIFPRALLQKPRGIQGGGIYSKKCSREMFSIGG